MSSPMVPSPNRAQSLSQHATFPSRARRRPGTAPAQTTPSFQSWNALRADRSSTVSSTQSSQRNSGASVEEKRERGKLSALLSHWRDVFGNAPSKASSKMQSPPPPLTQPRYKMSLAPPARKSRQPAQCYEPIISIDEDPFAAKLPVRYVDSLYRSFSPRPHGKMSHAAVLH